MTSMTFKLELMLMDPTKIRPSLVKKVLKILNKHNKTLTPISLLKVDQGASILLTWVINFIKWSYGNNKFTYDEKPQRIGNEFFDHQKSDQDNTTQESLIPN